MSSESYIGPPRAPSPSDRAAPLAEILRRASERLAWYDTQPKAMREACAECERTLANISEIASAGLRATPPATPSAAEDALTQKLRHRLEEQGFTDHHIDQIIEMHKENAAATPSAAAIAELLRDRPHLTECNLHKTESVGEDGAEWHLRGANCNCDTPENVAGWLARNGVTVDARPAPLTVERENLTPDERYVLDPSKPVRFALTVERLAALVGEWEGRKPPDTVDRDMAAWLLPRLTGEHG
jgi:hypothetical protein